MLVMTYSDARQNFASVLDKSESDGAVFVKRADGSLFRISPEQKKGYRKLRYPFEVYLSFLRIISNLPDPIHRLHMEL